MISKKPVRNAKLAKDYKEHFRKNHEGKIFCEICGQWGNEEYLLEVHHNGMAIANYVENNRFYSTFDDVIIACVICHKRIHNIGYDKTVEMAK